MSYPDSTARAASSNTAAPSSRATASAMSISKSRRTRPSTVETSSAEMVVPGEGDDLVERALRVAHAAVAGARQQRQRRGVELNVLGVGNLLQLVGDLA